MHKVGHMCNIMLDNSKLRKEVEDLEDELEDLYFDEEELERVLALNAELKQGMEESAKMLEDYKIQVKLEVSNMIIKHHELEDSVWKLSKELNQDKVVEPVKKDPVSYQFLSYLASYTGFTE